MYSVAGQDSLDVRELGEFSGAVMGWGSFSHIVTRASQIDALTAMGAATPGPILVSFLSFSGGTQKARRSRHKAGNFSIFVGFYHTATEAEFVQLATAADLTVVALNTDETEFTWPHAILQRRAG